MNAVWGDFEVDFDALLGRGGMGSVYRARQVSLDRPVAVKVLDASRAPSEELEEAFLQKFRIEARALAKLSDPRIITILQSGQNDGKCWYAMELIAGRTVDERLTKDGMLPEREAARVAAEVARALDAAHKQGIIHRDVKPGNVFLLDDGQVKLGDFGLARSPQFAATRMTEMNAVAATPTYASPEQGLGGECDHRSDIYSLGVVLYEMATERPPFGGDNSMETLYHHMHDEPPPMRVLNPTLSPAIEAVVKRCLAKEPLDRYQTYAELIRDLDAVATGTPIQPVAAAPAVAVVASGSPSPTLRILAIAGALAVSFILARIYRQESSPPSATPSPTPKVAALQHSPEPPSKEPTKASPSPTPLPDPLAGVRRKIEELIGQGKSIDALQLASENGLPFRAIDAARREAEEALSRDEGEPAVRFGRFAGDEGMKSEGEAILRYKAGDFDSILSGHLKTRGASLALAAIRREFMDRDSIESPFDPYQIWQEEGRGIL